VRYRVTRLLRSSPVHPRCALEFLLGTVLSLAATASALACAAPGKVNGPTKKPAPQTAPATRLQPSLQSVQEINLERQCFRCPNRYRLTFRRDGIATRTIFSAPAEQQESRGMVTRKEFDALVMLLQREGFFDLAEVYRDPQIEDGAWPHQSSAQQQSGRSANARGGRRRPRRPGQENRLDSSKSVRCKRRSFAWG
jgi:hypothetical protein